MRPASQGPDSSTETGSHVPPHPRDGEFFEGRSLLCFRLQEVSSLSLEVDKLGQQDWLSEA